MFKRLFYSVIWKIVDKHIAFEYCAYALAIATIVVGIWSPTGQWALGVLTALVCIARITPIIMHRNFEQDQKVWRTFEDSDVFQFRSESQLTPEIASRVSTVLERVSAYSPVIINWDLQKEQEFVTRVFRRSFPASKVIKSVSCVYLPDKYLLVLKGRKDKVFPEGYSWGPLSVTRSQEPILWSLNILMHEYAHCITKDESVAEHLAITAGLFSHERKFFVAALLELQRRVIEYNMPMRNNNNWYTASLLYMDWEYIDQHLLKPIFAMTNEELHTYLDEEYPLLEGRSYSDETTFDYMKAKV